MDIQEIDRVIKQAKLFLNQNTPPKEKEFWVDGDGNLKEVPENMWFDAKADTLRFKK